MLKWHQNLISFWRPLGTRFVRPKRRQDAPAPQIAAEDGVGPGLLGEDLGGGSPDVQTPRTFESRTWSKKMDLEGQEDLVEPFSTPSPVGRRIEIPLGGVGIKTCKCSNVCMGA